MVTGGREASAVSRRLPTFPFPFLSFSLCVCVAFFFSGQVLEPVCLFGLYCLCCIMTTSKQLPVLCIRPYSILGVYQHGSKAESGQHHKAGTVLQHILQMQYKVCQLCFVDTTVSRNNIIGHTCLPASQVLFDSGEVCAPL